MGCCFKPHTRTNTKIKGSNMEIAGGALAMAAKNKINTEIAGLAKPQTTKRTQKIKLKKHLPAHVATNVVIYVFVTVAFHPLQRKG